MSDMPTEGANAPAFTGINQDGEQVSLADYSGRKVALYFYPKDNTPGCTKQACNLRDNYSELLSAGIQVVGVSRDSVESHEKFADKFDLPFPLIADTNREIMEAYGVWGEKKLYGRVSIGVKRTTFLIDESGVIKKVIRRPKTADHSAEVLRWFEN